MVHTSCAGAIAHHIHSLPWFTPSCVDAIEVLFGQAQPDFRLRNIFAMDFFLNILQPW